LESEYFHEESQRLSSVRSVLLPNAALAEEGVSELFQEFTCVGLHL
jgi:hypothetical protein